MGDLGRWAIALCELRPSLSSSFGRLAVVVAVMLAVGARAVGPQLLARMMLVLMLVLSPPVVSEAPAWEF